MAEAEHQYQLALKDKPDHLAALLGYAHLKDYSESPDDAIQLYQRAANTHPQQASVPQQLGPEPGTGSTGRRKRWPPSAGPSVGTHEPLYRNNIATDLGGSEQVARGLPSTAAGAYRCGGKLQLRLLLNKKGQTQAAMMHFDWRLKADPSDGCGAALA